MKSLDSLFQKIDTTNFYLPEILSEPVKYKNTGNQDLFGYPPNQMANAALYYQYNLNHMNFMQAESFLSDLKTSIIIEEISMICKKALFGNSDKVPFIYGIRDIMEIIVKLYSQFSNKSEEEIRDICNRKTQIYKESWEEIVPDEDNITPEQLGRFYGSLPFPVGCMLTVCAEHNLGLAFRMFPVILAQSQNAKKVFDFGGNSGLITSVMAKNVNLDTCLLIEENNTLLNFAKWRDALFGINNVTYKKESEIINNIEEFKDTFDLGICTEVLEHVYFVEETVEVLSKLIIKGGLLYQSTSFGLYPMPSHLKRNLQYFNHEDELMSRHGFERVNVNFPLRLLSNTRIYRKL